MEKIVPLYTDAAFKALISNKKYQKVLEFITSILLDVSIEEVRGRVEVKDREILKQRKNEKAKRVDVLLEYEEILLNIEMNANKREQDYLIIRNSNYIFAIYVRNYKKGELYNKRKVVQYNFNRFPIADSQKEVAHHKFTFYDKQHAYELKNNIEIHYLNIEKCREVCYNKGIGKKDKLIKIGALLTCRTTQELEKILKGDDFMDEDTKKELRKAVKELSEDAFIISEFDVEEEERRYQAYVEEKRKENERKHQEQLHQYQEEIKKSKEEIQKSKEEIKKSKEKVKESKEEGIKKGMLDSARSIAKRMLQENLDISLIVKLTNLSEEEILSLK